jgi:dTMP kinase
LPFFERTRARYLELAAADSRIKTIDASQTIEQVKASIEQTLKNWFDEQATREHS